MAAMLLEANGGPGSAEIEADAALAAAARARLAVVIPVFDEEETLAELYRRLRETFDRMPDVDARVLYVDDGSRDGSLATMLAQRAEDPRFCVVELSRNFGHQPALTAGLELADADAVVLMDGDLQDPPELIPELVASWLGGAEVVRAVRRDRAERGLRRVGFDLFHRFFGWISDYPIPSQVGIFGLLDRRALAALRRLPEKHRYLPGLRAWIGFEQREVFYERKERAAGEPKQTLWRLARYAFDGFFSFSYKPLRLMVAVGAVVSLAGFGLASVFIVKRLAGIETAPTGFTTLITMVLFMGGVQLFAVGLVGEYLGRVYDEVKQRPLYIVRDRHGVDPAPERARPPATRRRRLRPRGKR
jgi:glycosyltransferase involved in cell wall biosynthesis